MLGVLTITDYLTSPLVRAGEPGQRRRTLRGLWCILSAHRRTANFPLNGKKRQGVRDGNRRFILLSSRTLSAFYPPGSSFCSKSWLASFQSCWLPDLLLICQFSAAGLLLFPSPLLTLPTLVLVKCAAVKAFWRVIFLLDISGLKMTSVFWVWSN